MTFRVLAICIFCSFALGEQAPPPWQEQVRKCAQEQDWTTAMAIVDREIARSPEDMDIRAWRARILMWSGRLVDAENEYRMILAVEPADADHWMGLATVYAREGHPEKAQQALDHGLEIDAKRADLHAARGRALRATGKLGEAKQEFQKALQLDPASEEARAGLVSLRGDPKQELRFGVDTDLFNFAAANQDGGVSWTSHWTSRWMTTASERVYRRTGTDAERVSASVGGKSPRWGALAVGGATARDNGVIPKSEAFFDYDRGFKIGQNCFVHGLEIDYGQHWYWYQTARILAIQELTVLYLPREWSWSLGLTGARSQFPATGAEWRPSGLTKLNFPIAGNQERPRLGGNLFFAVGTENFAQVDQIGRFSSQTYGGGLRFELTARQDVTGFGAYQKRTQDRTETSFGFSYGIRF